MKPRPSTVVHAVLASAVTVLLGACFLAVDTDGLGGGAPPGGGDAALDSTPPVNEPGNDAGADAEAGLAPDPCAGGPVLCETFDRATSLPGYPLDTDPETAITLDDAGSLSPPYSAKFVIVPSTDNTSPDATMEVQTSTVLTDFVFEGAIHIERSEPGEVARLLLLSTDAGSFYLNQDGEVRQRGNTLGNVGPIPTGRWITIRVEATADPPSAIYVIDGTRHGPFSLAASWENDPVLARFGVSEANSPTTGWIVRWDNIVIRKL